MGKHVQDSAPGLAGNQDHLRLPLALSVRTGLPQVGLCMTFNRILNFHVVRSTRPCQFTPASSPSIRDWGSLFLRIDRSDSGSGRARRVFGGPVSGDLVACPSSRASSARRNSAIFGTRATCSEFPTVDGLGRTVPTCATVLFCVPPTGLS